VDDLVERPATTGGIPSATCSSPGSVMSPAGRS